MKKGLSIKILLLIASIFSSQLANAYCWYLGGKQPSPKVVTIKVYKTRRDFEASSVGRIVKEKILSKYGETIAAAGPKIAAGVKIADTAAQLWTMLADIFATKAKHSLIWGAKSTADPNVKDYACWNWNDINKDVFSGTAGIKYTIFAAVFHGNKYLGSGYFPIGGYGVVKLLDDGKWDIKAYFDTGGEPLKW